MKARNDFGELELRQWWRDHDPLPECAERRIAAELEVGESVDLIVAAVRWSK